MFGELTSFAFAYLSIHNSSDDYTALFGNMSDKGKYLVVEADDICFITVILRTVIRSDCCTEVSVKCSTPHSPLECLDTMKGFFNTITVKQSYTSNDGIDRTLQMPRQKFILTKYRGILFLVHYDSIYVFLYVLLQVTGITKNNVSDFI